MRIRRIGAVAAAMAMALGLSACGLVGGGGSEEGQTVVQKAEDTGKLTIGIKFDQPGLGFQKPDGTLAGFDVDVAKYIAGKLGVEEKDIEFKETVSANRESFLEQGQVDLVIASYSITDERDKRVDFAGPYYVAKQDILVSADNKDIKELADLKGKTLCSAKGSRSAYNVTETENVEAQLQEAGSYSECIQLLKGGTVDAVTTDDVILAGYSAEYPGEFRIVGDKFSTERYGVGLPDGETETCKAVTDAIAAMYEDGTAEKLLDKHFGPAGFEYSTKLPEQDKCS